MALLEIDSPSFRVPAHALPEGLDMSVDTAEVHALVGTNGSGEIRFGGPALGITLGRREPVRFEGLAGWPAGRLARRRGQGGLKS